MRLTRLRLGESIVLLGAVGIVVALTLPWYENSQGKLSAWDTFGFGVALLMLAATVGLVLVAAPRSPSARPRCRWRPPCGAPSSACSA